VVVVDGASLFEAAAPWAITALPGTAADARVPIFRLGFASNPVLPCAGAGRRLRAGGGRRALRGVAAAHAR